VSVDKQPLKENDFKSLARCFISSEIAEQAGIFRVASKQGADIVGRKNDRDYSGVVFPYCMPESNMTVDYRLRRDNPELERKDDGTLKEREKYLSAPGKSNHIYFPPNVLNGWVKDTSLPIVITEGEKKTLALWCLAWHQLSDAAMRPRFLPLGLSGVWNFRGNIGKITNENGKRVDEKGVISDFHIIEWQGREVIICYDTNVNTNESVSAARFTLTKELRQRGAVVRWTSLPDSEGVNGIDDYLGLHGAESGLAILDSAIEPTSKKEETIHERQQERRLPQLSNDALYGLAERIVHTIEPHTESDNAALLIQLLTAFGNAIGRTAYFKVESTHHYLNLFAVLIGTSSKARKGTSWQHIRRIFFLVTEDWTKECIQHGLSSGEGLIHHVRDSVEKTEKGELKIVDEGAKDKRAFVIESEFASVLRRMPQQGNTLSAVIRQAWDDGNLRTMTVNPKRATDAHISIIGHITQDELKKNLDETETGNGFANRFLWVFVRRSKLLPDGGNLQDSDLNFEVRDLRRAVEFARTVGAMKRDAAAHALWYEVYERLSDGQAGLLGSVTSRAEAQVMRLACLYALLDCTDTIRVEHLESALALWQYCEDSARYVFGDSLGDKTADTILLALRDAGQDGLTQTDISTLFKRNKSAGEITRALNMLAERGLAYSIKDESENGRSAVRWFAVSQSNEKYERNERTMSEAA